MQLTNGSYDTEKTNGNALSNGFLTRSEQLGSRTGGLVLELNYDYINHSLKLSHCIIVSSITKIYEQVNVMENYTKL